MKSLKAVAVIAGSLIAVGVGSPAFALGVGTADLVSTNINGSETTIESDGTVQSDELDPENKDSTLHKVKGAAEGMNNPPALGRIAGVSVPR